MGLKLLSKDEAATASITLLLSEKAIFLPSLHVSLTLVTCLTL